MTDRVSALAMVASTPGATYRQLDYWTTTGRLTALDRRAGAGSGVPRFYPPGEAAVFALAVALTRSGLDVNTAFRVARTDPDGARQVLAVLTKEPTR